MTGAAKGDEGALMVAAVCVLSSWGATDEQVKKKKFQISFFTNEDAACIIKTITGRKSGSREQRHRLQA